MTLTNRAQPVRLEPSPGWPVAVAAATLALATGLGFVIAPIAGTGVRLIEATPFPVPGLLRLVADLPLAWTVPILSALGLAAAVMIAAAMVHECARLTIDRDAVEYRDEHGEGYLSRDRIGGVFRDGAYVVIWDHRTRPLARLKAELLSTDRLRRAFADCGYRWLGDHDPQEHAYQRWINGHPGLGSNEHALLARRRDALKTKDHATAARLGRELIAAAVIVRDRGGVQQYRTLNAGGEEEDGKDGGPGPA